MTAYVLATDGLLYRDPVIRGDGWYIVFDGYDDPELVLEAGVRLPAQARLTAIEILEQVGLTAIIVGAPRLMTKAFDQQGTDQRSAYCFWLEVTQPLPRQALASDASGYHEPQPDPDLTPVVVDFSDVGA